MGKHTCHELILMRWCSGTVAAVSVPISLLLPPPQASVFNSAYRHTDLSISFNFLLYFSPCRCECCLSLLFVKVSERFSMFGHLSAIEMCCNRVSKWKNVFSPCRYRPFLLNPRMPISERFCNFGSLINAESTTSQHQSLVGTGCHLW